MIRKINIGDKEKYLDMSRKFYSSDAVLHGISDDNIYKTFEMIISDNPYVEGYIIELDGDVAGYLLVSNSYSNESGGLILWIEELYILPEYQGNGFGKEFMSFIEETYKDRVVRIRLEVEESNEKAIKLYEKIGFTKLQYLQMYKKM